MYSFFQQITRLVLVVVLFKRSSYIVFLEVQVVFLEPDQPTGTDMNEQNDPLQISNEEEHDKNPHGNTQVTKESEIKIYSACDDKSVASYDCKECQDILCDMCFQSHRIVKLTRNHTLTLLRL